MRSLYDFLLRLHPPQFRERFAAEMMLNFEEAEQSKQPPCRLFLDCLISLLRQWLLRSALWKLALAIVCASFQLLAFGLLWHLPAHGDRHAMTIATTPQGLQGLLLGVVAVTLLTATMTALWVWILVKRRLSFAVKTRHSFR
jgi:hypothetical protein